MYLENYYCLEYTFSFCRFVDDNHFVDLTREDGRCGEGFNLPGIPYIAFLTN